MFLAKALSSGHHLFAGVTLCSVSVSHTRKEVLPVIGISLRDRQWWSTVKKAAGMGRTSEIPVIRNESGMEFTTSDAKADELCRFFAAKCCLGNDLTTGLTDVPSSETLSDLPCVRFRTHEVRRELASLDPSKATGPDSVPARVLKHCSAELCRPLARLFS